MFRSNMQKNYENIDDVDFLNEYWQSYEEAISNTILNQALMQPHYPLTENIRPELVGMLTPTDPYPHTSTVPPNNIFNSVQAVSEQQNFNNIFSENFLYPAIDDNPKIDFGSEQTFNNFIEEENDLLNFVLNSDESYRADDNKNQSTDSIQNFIEMEKNEHRVNENLRLIQNQLGHSVVPNDAVISNMSKAHNQAQLSSPVTPCHVNNTLKTIPNLTKEKTIHVENNIPIIPLSLEKKTINEQTDSIIINDSIKKNLVRINPAFSGRPEVVWKLTSDNEPIHMANVVWQKTSRGRNGNEWLNKLKNAERICWLPGSFIHGQPANKFEKNISSAKYGVEQTITYQGKIINIFTWRGWKGLVIDELKKQRRSIPKNWKDGIENITQGQMYSGITLPLNTNNINPNVNSSAVSVSDNPVINNNLLQRIPVKPRQHPNPTIPMNILPNSIPRQNQIINPGITLPLNTNNINPNVNSSTTSVSSNPVINNNSFQRIPVKPRQHPNPTIPMNILPNSIPRQNQIINHETTLSLNTNNIYPNVNSSTTSVSSNPVINNNSFQILAVPAQYPDNSIPRNVLPDSIPLRRSNIQQDHENTYSNWDKGNESCQSFEKLASNKTSDQALIQAQNRPTENIYPSLPHQTVTKKRKIASSPPPTEPNDMNIKVTNFNALHNLVNSNLNSSRNSVLNNSVINNNLFQRIPAAPVQHPNHIISMNVFLNSIPRRDSIPLKHPATHNGQNPSLKKRQT